MGIKISPDGNAAFPSILTVNGAQWNTNFNRIKILNWKKKIS